MTRLYVVVEGQTEEAFIKAVIAPHLLLTAIEVYPIIVATKLERTGRKHRGGGHWQLWRRDIRRVCGEQKRDARVTTMFDLYGLPPDFPGLDTHRHEADTRVRCEKLEQAMQVDIDDWRFIPYLQRHEFEALVLAGLPELEKLLDHPADLAGLGRLRADVGPLTPEDVDDGPETAPSKRLGRFIPAYNRGGKVLYGELVTEGTGIAVLRSLCPRFGDWIGKLEALGDVSPGLAGTQGAATPSAG